MSKVTALIYLVDRPELLELYQTILSYEGYTNLQMFSDPKEALKAMSAAKQKPRLLIATYLLYSQDGFSLNGLELIAASKGLCPKIGTLLTSALSLTKLQSRVEAARVRPDAIVEKLNLVPTLAKTVARLLWRRRRKT